MSCSVVVEDGSPHHVRLYDFPLVTSVDAELFVLDYPVPHHKPPHMYPSAHHVGRQPTPNGVRHTSRLAGIDMCDEQPDTPQHGGTLWRIRSNLGRKLGYFVSFVFFRKFFFFLLLLLIVFV